MRGTGPFCWPGSSVGTSVRLKSGRSPVRSRPWPPHPCSSSVAPSIGAVRPARPQSLALRTPAPSQQPAAADSADERDQPAVDHCSADCGGDLTNPGVGMRSSRSGGRHRSTGHRRMRAHRCRSARSDRCAPVGTKALFDSNIPLRQFDFPLPGERSTKGLPPLRVVQPTVPSYRSVTRS